MVSDRGMLSKNLFSLVGPSLGRFFLTRGCQPNVPECVTSSRLNNYVNNKANYSRMMGSYL